MADLLTTDPRYRHTAMLEASLDDKVFALRCNPSPVKQLVAVANALEANDHTEALRQINEAIDLRPGEPVYIEARAFANLSAENWDALQSDLDELAELKHENAWTWHVRALLARRAGNLGGALEALDRSLELAEEPNPELFLVRASLLIRLDRDKEATATLDRYSELCPSNPELFRMRAQLAERGNDTEAALVWIRKAIETADEPHSLRWIESAYLANLDRNADALESINAAIKDQPDDPDYLERRATINESLGDFAAVLADLDRVIELVPSDTELRLRRAHLVHTQLKRPDLALPDLDLAIQSNPTDARLYWFRANLHQQLGHTTEHRADLAELRRRNPDLYRELTGEPTRED